MINKQTVNNVVLPALINGDNQYDIADKAGCNQSTISRLKAKLSDQLEAYQLQLIDQAGNKTVQNITSTINRANSILTDDTIDSGSLSDYKDLLTLSHKKEVLIGQTMGILPSHTSTVNITNILSIKDTPSAGDIDRIRELIEGRQAADIVDVTPLKDTQEV